MPLAKRTNQSPGGHHGRAQPYKSTPQEKGKWKATRGKTPNGVTEADWIQAFNRADDKIRKSLGKKKAAAARESGETRDAAIDDLIQRGMLAYNFVDTDV
ncbi:hypothetical protein NA56DRAFT_208848 [Hyaloscypha hepaticicola]|uniref:Uncharacterized protein n=1 Tax=Hyaloscypha hepaticicola TaxID=2082293 RepID=A0A2J6PXZ1_9HELO|nr:hypothetical protein NA56DRAFT_208848 [Hyaloscypha hepaticicola]